MSARDEHEHAQALVAASLAGAASAEELAFLQRHLAECRPCAGAAEDMEQGLHALRSVVLRASPVLVAATQRRVRERAAQLRDDRARRAWLVASGLLAVLLTAATSVSLWHVLGWAADRLEVPPLAWMPVILALWLMPGTLAAAAAWLVQGAAGVQPAERY